MNNYSTLTNKELLDKLKKNLQENELIFEEIIEREQSGNLTKPKDLILEQLKQKRAS